ncbi:MAG: DNA gyrase inhibitor YacG [Pseudomonadota bacterium]
MSCPICEKETEPKYRPFCSKRCADLDLAKWLSGSYAIPSESAEDLEEAAREAEVAPKRQH